MVPSSTSGVRVVLALVRAAHPILIPKLDLGLGRVSPRLPNLSFWENLKKKRFFRHNCYSATTVKPMAAAMAPPVETHNATAIWWHFFKNPPCHTAMAPP